ncbi:MAG: BatD family protein [Gemmatimonadales bacterium]
MIGVLFAIAQLAIVAHAPDSVSACDAIEISVAVQAPGSVAPRLVVPSFGPFDVLRSSPVPHLTYDSRGDGSVMAEYRYVLTTDHLGTFSIPPFEARLGSASARSRLIQIAVRPPGGRPSVPTVVARARIDTSLQVSFRAATAPETVFVGQQANYEVAVFLNQTVRDRLRRNPTFFPPDMQSMLAYDIPARGDSRREVGSHCFEALVYQRALFPLLAGRFSIPPAQLVYSLPLSASFFSREETHELETDSTVLIAVEPPSAGRPLDYGGAVGNLRVAAHLDTNETRVGDPLLLTVRVSGTGNVKLLPRPPVGVSWATLVNGDERVQVDTTARRIAGSKEFDWVLTPRIAGELDVPPIHYSFFNPESRRYETTATRPAHVFVLPGTLASADTARTETLLALRPRYRGPLSKPLHDHPAFWALLALAPLPAITLRTRERGRVTTDRGPTGVERLALLNRDAAKSRDARGVRQAFTAVLAERLGLGADAFTRTGSLARALRRRGVSTDVAQDAEGLLRQLDEAAFSASGALPPDALERVTSVCKQIDAEALPRTRLVVTTLCIVGLVAVGVGTAQAYDAVAARRAFDAGVAAYQHHDFVAAREGFIEAVAAEPRAPDAWANLGTAAWAAADTARSVAAWQRALRLEPLAGDMRDRVDLVHSLPWSSAGYVPPLPPAWLFNVAALLWCIAWGDALRRAVGRRAEHRRLVTALTVSAAVIVIAALALRDRLSGHTAAVVRQTASLSHDPQLGAERGATAIVGEVVRVSGRQGAWSHVALDDGRDGWLESSSLISLDERDVSIGGD